MSVGSRVRLVNLQRADLNGRFAVVVSVGAERVGVELEKDDHRVAVRPLNLEAVTSELALDSEIALGSRVVIKGLQRRPDLNSRSGIITAIPQDSNERWRVNFAENTQDIGVLYHNLLQLPCPPDLDIPVTPASLHRQDLVLIRFAAKYGSAAVTFAEDRAACSRLPLKQSRLLAAARLRQELLFTWGVLPTDPQACVNFALAPTLVLGMLAVEPRMQLGEVFKVHCIGATPDFEGCADWSGLGELLAAAGFALPRAVEITYFGNDQSFVLPPGLRSWSMMQKSTNSNGMPKVTVRHVDELYHAKSRAVPDVALLCHPGFDNYMELWHPTMGILFYHNIPLLVAGHSNFAVPSHDAIMHQDLGLAVLGAKIIHRQMWNPFCQAYHDPSKGSLLAPCGQEHNHCNLALISVSQGGDLKQLKDVDACFDVLDYLAVSVQGFPEWEALGPELRDTGLKLKYPFMTEGERGAAVKLLQDLTQGTLPIPSEADKFMELLQERGLAAHYGRKRGSW